jgi:hypothetical protein
LIASLGVFLRDIALCPKNSQIPPTLVGGYLEFSPTYGPGLNERSTNSRWWDLSVRVRAEVGWN